MKVVKSIPHYPRSFSVAYCVLFKMKTKVTIQVNIHSVQKTCHTVDKANLQVYVLSHTWHYVNERILRHPGGIYLNF